MLLNEEQKLLQDSIGNFLAESAPVSAMRALRNAEDARGYDPNVWQQLVKLGVAGMVLPEHYGGSDFGYMGMGAVMELCGQHLTASPLLSSVLLSAKLLEHAGSDEQKQAMLPGIAAGTLNLALAIDEGKHFAPLQTALSASADNGNYELNGKKVFVLDGSSANAFIVVARSAGQPGDEHGLTLFLVDRDTPGLSCQSTLLFDGHDASILQFDQVQLTKEQLLGEESRAWLSLSTVLERATICLAAEMLGGATELFNRTVAYLQEREQFGVKIGSFQALQHRAAHMFVLLENLRSVVWNALHSLDTHAAEISINASHAKALANNTVLHISNEATQMHGGMGVTDELDIGMFLKRSRVCMQMLGDSSYHADRYAHCMGY